MIGVEAEITTMPSAQPRNFDPEEAEITTNRAHSRATCPVVAIVPDNDRWVDPEAAGPPLAPRSLPFPTKCIPSRVNQSTLASGALSGHVHSPPPSRVPPRIFPRRLLVRLRKAPAMVVPPPEGARQLVSLSSLSSCYLDPPPLSPVISLRPSVLVHFHPVRSVHFPALTRTLFSPASRSTAQPWRTPLRTTAPS